MQRTSRTTLVLQNDSIIDFKMHTLGRRSHPPLVAEHVPKPALQDLYLLYLLVGRRH
jgi:hypothetical protein